MSAGTFSIKSTSNDRFWRSFPWQFYLLGDHNEPNCKWGFRLLVSFTVFPSKYWIRLRASVFFTLSWIWISWITFLLFVFIRMALILELGLICWLFWKWFSVVIVMTVNSNAFIGRDAIMSALNMKSCRRYVRVLNRKFKEKVKKLHWKI